MKYEDFKRINDQNKRKFNTYLRIEEVDFKSGTCTTNFCGNITTGIVIKSIVDDVCFNEMGALSNPSKLKGWKGFDK